MAPAPNRFHQEISRNLEYIFLRYLEDHPIGKVFDAPFDVQLTDVNVFQPDIIFLAREHYALQTKQGITGGPDLVVEILSPRTAELDQGVKRELYARCGVRELWIIDPDSLRINVFRLQENAESPERVYQGDATIETPLMPGLQVALARVFADAG